MYWANKYRIIIPTKIEGVSEKVIDTLTRGVTLPGREFQEIEIFIQGKRIILPGEETFSGRFNIDRKELKRIIEVNGGKYSSSLSKKTSYLIAGEKIGPSKKIKAEALGIKIISEDHFFNNLL